MGARTRASAGLPVERAAPATAADALIIPAHASTSKTPVARRRIRLDRHASASLQTAYGGPARTIGPSTPLDLDSIRTSASPAHGGPRGRGLRQRQREEAGLDRRAGTAADRSSSGHIAGQGADGQAGYVEA